MTFVSYNSYLNEYENLHEFIQITKYDSVRNEYGFIDYYYELSDRYPNGLIVDLGGHVDKKHRGKGVFKDLFKQLLSSFPEGTILQMSVVNPKLVKFFKRIGFTKVKEIEYWGKTPHAMQGVLTNEMKKLI